MLLVDPVFLQIIKMCLRTVIKNFMDTIGSFKNINNSKFSISLHAGQLE